MEFSVEKAFSLLFFKEETPAQVFSDEFCKVFKITYFV